MKNRHFNKRMFWQIAAVFFIQLSSTIAYAVFYSGLSLYLTQNKIFSEELAATITSLFLSLNYALPLVGGVMVNKIISYKKFYLLGTVVSFLGCTLLAFNGNLYLSLALFLMSSLVNVCLNMFLTQLFQPEEKTERRIAFLWNYVGMNLGFMLGYFLTGLSTISNNYHSLFVAMSVMTLISLLLTIIFIKEPKVRLKRLKSGLSQVVLCLLGIALLVLLIGYVFRYATFLQHTIFLIAILAVSASWYYAFKKMDPRDTKNLFHFILFSIFAICFWSFYLLTPIAIMQLIQHAVDRTIFGFLLAPQWIVNIDSVIILLLAPLLALALKKNKLFFNNSYNYFLLGFLSIACGFLLLGSGIYFSLGNQYIPLMLMLGYLLFITVAEIFVAPASNALIGELIPESLRGVMTGAWGMNICIGGFLASIIAKKFFLLYIGNHGLNFTGSTQLCYMFFACGVFSLVLVLFIFLIFTRKGMIHNFTYSRETNNEYN